MSLPDSDEDPSCPPISRDPAWKLINMDALVAHVVSETDAFWTVYEPYLAQTRETPVEKLREEGEKGRGERRRWGCWCLRTRVLRG
jgi:hypothetical protein